MNAETEAFKNSIADLDRETLVSLLVDAHEKNARLENELAEFRRTSTAMSKDYQTMKDDLAAARESLKEKDGQIKTLQEQNEALTRNVYGSHTETSDAIMNSFSSDSSQEDPISEDASEDKGTGRPSASGRSGSSGKGSRGKGKNGNRRSGKKKKKADFSHLVHVNVYDLDCAALDAKYGKGNWEIIGWHNSEKLEVTRPVFYIRVIHTAVIKVKNEEKKGKPKASPLRGVLLKRSMVTASVLATSAYNKFAMGLPVDRQVRDLNLSGIPLSKMTLNNWILYGANIVLRPIYEHLCTVVKKCPYNHCDETTLQVILDGRSAGSKSYIWVHSTGLLYPGNRATVYIYEPTRGTRHLREFYIDYEGAITCDAYVAYKVFEGERGGRVKITGCLAHARRRFVLALHLLNVKGLSDDAISELPEVKAIELIGMIYKEESLLKDLDAATRKAMRQGKVKKAVDSFYEYIRTIDTDDPSISNRLKDAVSYALNQEEYLRRFLDDGNIPCDNLEAERNIRNVAVGRRNWLFCNTPDGAEACMVYYSIVETAKQNGAHPYYYLKYLLEKVPEYLDGTDRSFAEKLMPWTREYQEYEKASILQDIHSSVPLSDEKPYYRPDQKYA